MKNLMFLMMLFGLIFIITDSASAQNLCSKNLDGRKVNFKIVNKTNKAFTVHWVDDKCKEGDSNQQIAPGGSTDIFGYNGHVFRIREVGTRKVLQDVVANPSTPSQITIGVGTPNNAANNAANNTQPPNTAKQSPPASGNQQSNVAMATKFPVTAGQALKKDVKYLSPSGNHYLILQNDGNMIIKTKNDGYVWGLDQMKKNSADRVEFSKEGSLTAYDKQSKAIWSPQAKRDPSAKLTITFNGALQMVAGNGEILWSSDGNLSPSINVFMMKPNVKQCTADPGWAKCIELTNPAIKIMGSSAASQSAMNGVANVYTEMTKNFGDNYPKNKFDGFKVYLTNGEPWSVLSRMSPVGTMWKDQTGPTSGNFLRGGASQDFLWISEQMICKQGVKTRNADGTPDNSPRTLDQVVHEFAHSIDYKYIPDQTVNIFNGNGTPVESFAYRAQNWFGAPSNTIPPNQEAVLKGLFISRATFSCEGYKP